MKTATTPLANAEAVAKPVPPAGMRILAVEWLRTHALPADGFYYNPETTIWKESYCRGRQLPSACYLVDAYATAADLPPEAFAQPTPSGPTAVRDPNYDDELKAARERIKELEAMLKDWLRIGPVSGMSMAQYVVATQAALTTAETKAGAMEERIKELEKGIVEAIWDVESAGDEQVAGASQSGRDFWYGQAANLAKLLPPAPSVASEKEGK